MSPRMQPVRLLLLSGASLVGQNVVAALQGRRAGVWLAALNSVAAEPALSDFDEAYLCGNLRDDREAFARRFVEVLERVDPQLVIPCRDDDVAFLAAFAESCPAVAPRLLCGSRATAQAMLDKLESAALSSRHRLPYAPTIDAAGPQRALGDFAATQGMPLVAKPRQGFASRGVFLVLDQAQLERVAGRPDYVLQRYLGDPHDVMRRVRQMAEEGMPLFHTFEAVKLSIQAFIAPDGSLAGLCATRNIMRQGRSERIELDADAALEELGRRCAAAFAGEGWRGPLNIQCQRAPDGELGIYEFNGRYTGATAARALLGYDEVGIGLAAFCGAALPAAPTPGVAVAVRVPLTRMVDAEQADRLREIGHWRVAHD